jgi:hypothetical protein
MVLIGLGVESADLTLTKRVIQGGVNLIGGDIHARCRRPVDDKILSQPPRLIVGCDVPQLRLLP